MNKSVESDERAVPLQIVRHCGLHSLLGDRPRPLALDCVVEVWELPLVVGLLDLSELIEFRFRLIVQFLPFLSQDFAYFVVVQSGILPTNTQSDRAINRIDRSGTSRAASSVPC